MVVVEVRHRTMWIADRSWTRRTRTRQEAEAEGRSGRQAGRQEATDIKSNNPHLAGGEIKLMVRLPWPERVMKSSQAQEASEGQGEGWNVEFSHFFGVGNLTIGKIWYDLT